MTMRRYKAWCSHASFAHYEVMPVRFRVIGIKDFYRNKRENALVANSQGRISLKCPVFCPNSFAGQADFTARPLRLRRDGRRNDESPGNGGHQRSHAAER